MSDDRLTIPKLRDALRTAEELGCRVREHASQLVITHERWSRPIKVWPRTKDTPFVLVVALRRLMLARDADQPIDVEMVQDVVSDASMFEREADPDEEQAVEIDAQTIARQSQSPPNEERVSVDEAAALVNRPVATVLTWIVRERLDVKYRPSDQSISASALDVLDHLSQVRPRRRRGEGAKFLPPLPIPIAQGIIEMNQPNSQPPPTNVTVSLSSDDRALAQALGLAPDAFVRLCVDQATKRLREKLRALMTEAA